MDLPEELGAAENPMRKQPSRNLEWRRFFRLHPKLKRTLITIGISAATSIVMIALVVLVGWKEREKVAALLMQTLPSYAGTMPLSTAPSQQWPQGASQTAPKELSVTEVVQKVNPSVVSIEVSQQQAVYNSLQDFLQGISGRPSGQTEKRVVGKGTGFFVTNDGYIVTNRHVVDFSNATFTVRTTADKEYNATLIAKDPIFDLAVLKISGGGFPAVSLGDSDVLQLGQSVVAIGFALGQFENSISVGVVSGLGRSIVAGGGGSSEQLDRVIQTDAAINPGNSGGPLINLKGEVVGVNVAVAQGSQSIGFSIPANDVRRVVDSIKAYGTIVRPYLGISYVQVSGNIQEQRGLAQDYGILISEVMPDSPALRAGIQAGDVVLSIDGTRLDGDPSFAGLIRTKRIGQSITLVIIRNGVQSTVKATLARAPEA